MLDSDSLYHRLFSHPGMVESLVREFIPEALVSGLNFSRLQRVNAKFYTGQLSGGRREGDVIWRLPPQSDAENELYLLIEFQSQSDRWMAVRTQVYQGLLWQQIIAEKGHEAIGRLPALLLLVLYNGTLRWSAATHTHGLIALSPDSALWSLQPQCRYHLLDIGALCIQDLTRCTTPVALLFRLEQSTSLEDLEVLLAEVINWFQRHEGFDSLQRLFAELVCKLFAGLGLKLSKSDDLQTMRTNLWALGQSWKKQWRAEARAEGIAEGKAEGIAEGKAEALVCLLVERFDASAPSLRRRLRGANLKTLECWFKRAIVAQNLRSVFDPPP